MKWRRETAGRHQSRNSYHLEGRVQLTDRKLRSFGSEGHKVFSAPFTTKRKSSKTKHYVPTRRNFMKLQMDIGRTAKNEK